MRLIVGLGNPGPDYLMTRHNIGFMAVDALADRFGGIFKKEHKALTCKIRIGSDTALLAKPQTFMNLSGQAVQSIVDYYDIPINNIIVAHDEIDLPYETLRFQKNRGHAGHNGIRDIHKCLETNEYHRLKLGVGRPSNPRMNVADFVLQNFNNDELKSLPDFLGLAIDGLEEYIVNGFEKAASAFNSTGKGKS